MTRAVLTSFLSIATFAVAQASPMSDVALRDILAATNGKPCGLTAETTFARIHTDSRTVQPGDLFWALQGERHDGHNFIRDAFARGATAMVVAEHRKPESNPGPVITVPDTLRALWDFAAWHRTQRDAAVIGVTGSFGKTTAREMIFAALNAGHSGLRSPRNYNNHIGVPLTLLELVDHHEFAVLELGASAVGEIRELAKLAAPEIGVVTGVGPAHLDGFKTIEGIIAAKSELITALPACGFAVLNGDDVAVRQMANLAACPVILIGEQEHNDITAHRIEIRNNAIRFGVANDTYELPAIGRHHVTAALAAIAIGREIGLSPATIAEGLRNFQPVDGRCRLHRLGDWHVIDDTYNSNPGSLRAACATLRDWPGAGRRILVTGDMKELATETINWHHDAGRGAAEANIDLIVAHGDLARHVVGGAKEAGMDAGRLADCKTMEAVQTVLDCWLEPGDVVLVKGSRAMRMERIVEWLREQAEAKPIRRACA
jgi:UDP-N-acetylmuramoyl-tripeptide--D-alanyl-D-alanine ligase